MQEQNKITSITRLAIADELTIGKLWYHGRLTEPDFLSRIFDLNKMPSTDNRAEFNTAYKDIYKHTVLNYNDWEPDWIFTDHRFNLTHCADELYLRFLCETVHPAIRTSLDEQEKMVSIYNRHLGADDFEIIQTKEISARPVFSGRKKTQGGALLTAQKTEIKKYLNTDYVNSKINLMVDAVQKNTDIAIGTAKELLETICKSILKQKGIAEDSNWTLQRLIKETSNTLDFKPKDADDPEEAERSIKQVLGGIATIVHGVTELRNAYGTGHGKDADFKGLEIKYAKLLVGVVSEIAIIFLATNGEAAELVDEQPIF
jgi:hypothetical protein